ncbi:DUF1045 domain-containing protein [Roseibium sp.]|uniref:DUF1045 domain-containing protein n=1 Tax=Roseibium sp. TaxID=1936156 RepID=UPI003A984927
MRYAIYFAAPADDALIRAGNAWLGRDPFTGERLAQPTMNDLSTEQFAELTTDPRRYGFHGTLKAPFHLKDGATEAGLIAACEAMADETAPFEIQGLAVNALGKFLALTPTVPEPDLADFASLCVRWFEPFRTQTLNEADLERRRKSGLTPAQDRNLVEWGYPYIFDDFRFHMTLSNKVEDTEAACALKSAATDHFAELTARPRAITHFGLYTEAERGTPFKVHSIFPLGGERTPTAALADLLANTEVSK